MTMHAQTAGHRPLRLLMTADAVGGIWTYAQTLLSALGPDHVQATLAVIGPASPDRLSALRRRLPHVTVDARPFRLEWMPDGHVDVDRIDHWLARIARDIDADIIHINGYAPARASFDGRPVLVVAHSCVRSWWRAVHGTAAPSEWDTYSAHVKEALARATHIVAPTRAMANAIGFEYDTRRPIEVIQNGLPAPPPPPSPRQPFVLAAGRFWDEAKNLKLLDAAARGLVWPAFAAGRFLEDRDEPRHLRALGELDAATLASWMDRASIFAHPALYEPFGLAPLEAARGGCALVLSRIRSLQEIWGDAAVYVDPRDSGSLHSALARLVADAGWREHLARKAYVRAAYYSDTRMARAYLACYRRLSSIRVSPDVNPDVNPDVSANADTAAAATAAGATPGREIPACAS